MDRRKEKILNIIIKEHIKSGLPVGSSSLVDRYKLGISPATARNEMAELENLGFIFQPHTSAGRVPTDKAYQFYLQNIKEAKLNKEESVLLLELIKKRNEDDFKKAAKAIAKTSQQAVFWAFQKNNLYYTGISNLLCQPEFAQVNLMYDISEIIDKTEEIIDRVFDEIEIGINVFIGSDNPFSENCSSIIYKYRLGNKVGLLGILGPVRMNYEKNLALVNLIGSNLNHQ